MSGEFAEALMGLSASQARRVISFANALRKPVRTTAHQTSILSHEAVQEFADILRSHHSGTGAPFTKDKFEHALLEATRNTGIESCKAPTGNPGHDVTLGGVRYSAKTQADRAISPTHVHVSKFMEMGKGEWGDDPQHLIGLRDQFLQHLSGYESILVLRYLSNRYELLSFCPSIFQRCISGVFEMKLGSKQFPKPGYCRVYGDEGLDFELYFDGGGERKLQIKKLRRELAVVHAEWDFNV